MDLKNIADQMLLDKTLVLVREERRLLTEILHHLREIENRRLFSVLKYSSLFDYAVHELKYSESQAQRRISAMRLLREMPEIEHKIASGDLSLTNLNLAQTLFSRERKAGRGYSPEQKVQTLNDLEGKSKREAERIIYAAAPEMKPKDLDFNQIQDESLRVKLLQLKGMYAHTNPDMTLNELLHKLCDNSLSPAKTNSSKLERHIYERDGHKCTNCNSTQALQIDHVIPRAKRGPSTPDNLRLLCRKCNQRAAIEHFGRVKMGRHLRSVRAAYG